MTREEIAEIDPEVLLLEEEYDPAIVGLVRRAGQPLIALYDLERIRDHLVKVHGIPPEMADEHIDFNMTGAWSGPRSPGFIVPSG